MSSIPMKSKKIFVLFTAIIALGNAFVWAGGRKAPSAPTSLLDVGFIPAIFDGTRPEKPIGLSVRVADVTRNQQRGHVSGPRTVAVISGAWGNRNTADFSLRPFSLEVQVDGRKRTHPWRLTSHRVDTGMERVPPDITLRPNCQAPVLYRASPPWEMALDRLGFKRGAIVRMTLVGLIGDVLARVKLPPVMLRIL